MSVTNKLEAIRTKFEEEINQAAEDLQELAETLTGMSMYGEVDYEEMNKGLKKVISGIRYIEDNT
jgi:sensor domain CHASE-containing protein